MTLSEINDEIVNWGEPALQPKIHLVHAVLQGSASGWVCSAT